ncbi:barstar family protein [Luteimonas sp. e5]
MSTSPDLRDPSRAGVYRLMHADVPALQALADEADLAVHRIELADVGDKAGVLDAIAAALEFPADWGRNWDALDDALGDLSWLGPPRPRVLLLCGLDRLHRESPRSETVLCEVLHDACKEWAREGIALWALLSMQRCGPRLPTPADGCT